MECEDDLRSEEWCLTNYGWLGLQVKHEMLISPGVQKSFDFHHRTRRGDLRLQGDSILP